MSKPENSGNDHKQLLARITALETLQQVARDLTAELDHDALLQKILRAAITVSGSTAGSLFLYDRSTHELVFKVIVGGGGTRSKNSAFPPKRGLPGSVLRGSARSLWIMPSRTRVILARPL